MEINIDQKEITVVSGIRIDGKKYPLTPWNIDCAEDYLRTKDVKFIENLKDFALDLGN